MHFLPNLSSKGHTRFAGTDLPELFEKNLKIMPDTWHYRTKNIDYKYNKSKYRTYEFDNIDWNNSVTSSDYGVRVVIISPSIGTGAHRYYPPRLRHLVVNLPQSRSHFIS